jgi:HNH endonuclease/NUMOD4 motif
MDESSTEEIWMSIDGYEDLYEVSTLGRVRSWIPGTKSGTVPHILKSHSQTSSDHQKVALYRDGKPHTYRVHQLVMEAFIGPCPEGQQVRHLNGDPTDNRLKNLMYGTSSENRLDSVYHGTHYSARKTHCKRGHTFTEETTYVTLNSEGRVIHRVCKICHREYMESYRQRRAERGETCAQDDCDKLPWARGLCNTHYKQWHRNQNL